MQFDLSNLFNWLMPIQYDLLLIETRLTSLWYFNRINPAVKEYTHQGPSWTRLINNRIGRGLTNRTELKCKIRVKFTWK